MRLLGLAVVGIYAVLFVFGKEVAGTTAWLIVGGFSFQLTELTKVMTLLFYGLVFTDQDLTPDKRLVLTLIILAVNGVALLLLNELGTLCILGLAFFLMGWIYLPDVRKLVALALVLVPYIQSGDRALSSVYSVAFVGSALLVFFLFETLIHHISKGDRSK